VKEFEIVQIKDQVLFKGEFFKCKNRVPGRVIKNPLMKIH
jgi:hypothetical protein